MTSLDRTVMREPFWSLSVQDTLALLKSNTTGLSDAEAQERQRTFGKNILTHKSQMTKLRIVWHQLANPLIAILAVAGVMTWFLGEYIEVAVIFAAVLVNTALGFWQENKAETVLELLKSYVKTRTRVKRQGREVEIDAEDLVVGDIIRISQGDRIPADARILFVNNLEVDEAILTGESLPVYKKIESVSAATQMADRQSIIFSGTLVTEGVADAVVTATDNETEFGRIAKLASHVQEPTPLQKALTRFANYTGLVLAVLGVVLFLAGVAVGYELLDMFLIAVAVAVSAVPEGLPIAMTVILAVGVQRLAARKGIVRRLLAAETLGSTSLILTDKTGTLTQARMEIVDTVIYGEQTDHARRRLLEHALWNADTIIDNPADSPERWNIFGRSLHVSLVRQAALLGVRLPDMMGYGEVLGRLPFSSSYKFAAVAVRFGSYRRVILLGAPDILVRFTDLSVVEKDRIHADIKARAAMGQKVLGVASVEIKDSEYEKFFKTKHFRDMEFEGIISLSDPLRPQVTQALKDIAAAGVRTVMVTGDHAGTAEAIARQLGLIDGVGAVLTGEDLNSFQPEELAARASEVSVYARVTPEQKLMLTRMYQERGEVVAVTGDGVNDAPALTQADIGVALGSGSDVAKGAADLVILDDNYETIVAAIQEGRRIFSNIQKVLVYLLSNALDELMLIGGALLLGLPLPLTALQILFVNFFSDSFPAIALAFEKGLDGLKDHKIAKKNLFDPAVRFLILGAGVTTSLVLFLVYMVLDYVGVPNGTAQTVVFGIFATYAILLSFSMRSLERSIFTYNPFSNLYLVGGVGLGILLTAGVIYIPFFQTVFDTHPLPPIWLGFVLAVGLFNVSIFELAKYYCRTRGYFT